MLSARALAVRYRLSRLFDDDAPQTIWVRGFNAALAVLIVVNVAAVILESVEPLRARYSGVFLLIEAIATAIFTIEYVLRVWTAVEFENGRFRDPLWGRLRYMRGFFPLVDLVAVLPAFIGFFGAADLRVLRLLRLLRMLKLTRHSTIFAMLWAVIVEEGAAIAAVVFVLCLTLTVSGSLMYMIEGDQQPAVFTSIPASMWWAIETITTVGYGDMVPVTTAGRVLGGFVSIVGIGALALFSGLITAGYLNQLRLRRDQKAHMLHHHDHASTPPAHCPHCGSIIAGRPNDAATPS